MSESRLSDSRKLTDKEMLILERLLQADFSGREEIVQQLKHATVQPSDENGSLDFNIGNEPPLARVKNRIPVEARIVDVDGITVNILLHVVDGRLNELEVYRDDSGPVRGELAPERFTIYADHG